MALHFPRRETRVTSIWMQVRCRLRLVSSLVMGGTLIAFSGDYAFAQLVPDTTLGSENSRVTPMMPTIDQINGGATRDANLFHSFQEFNVGEGRSVYFTNPAGIENILTRVTGTNPSNRLALPPVIPSVPKMLDGLAPVTRVRIFSIPRGFVK